MLHTKEEKLQAFSRLLDVMDALREKCPWNAAQTMESIRPMTEEEVYELSDAIIKENKDEICKEIGDLLYHMVFYARIAQERGEFDIADSINKECDKMEFRHPHVFGDMKDEKLTAEQIAAQGDSFNYEFVCGISRRVPRQYVQSGKTVHSVHYLLDAFL